MDEVRRKLDELIARRPTATPRVPTPVAPVSRALGELLGGVERRIGRHQCWQVDTPFAAACARHGLEYPATLVAADDGCERAGRVGNVELRRGIVVDIETGGFSGTEVFLVGLALLDQRPLRVIQFLARDYPEEEAVLREVAELAEQRDHWVTFNGKAFDFPFLRDRATRYRVSLKEPAQHVDLLHAARREFRGTLPNCKLQTLETHLLGWQRTGDVPGADIPDLFHHFIRTGNAAVIRPVLEHNQLDLISSTEFLLRFGAGDGNGVA